MCLSKTPATFFKYLKNIYFFLPTKIRSIIFIFLSLMECAFAFKLLSLKYKHTTPIIYKKSNF